MILPLQHITFSFFLFLVLYFIIYFISLVSSSKSRLEFEVMQRTLNSEHSKTLPGIQAELHRVSSGNTTFIFIVKEGELECFKKFNFYCEF